MTSKGVAAPDAAVLEPVGGAISYRNIVAAIIRHHDEMDRSMLETLEYIAAHRVVLHRFLACIDCVMFD